jgi:hippurate hydrolase
MHNWPGLPAGRFAIRPGPLMAACDLFEITVDGKGCHGAMPHLGTDAIVAASALIQALQTIVSRTIDPQEPAVVSVTQVHAGETWNVLPARAVIRGTVRAFDETVQDRIEAAIRRLAQGTALALGLSAAVTYRRQYPATVNHAPETEQAARAAAQVVGEANVERNPTPTMGSEDFAFMLRERPGAYIWIGAGTGADDVPLHSPRYDFNDGILALGACYWATLVESLLPREAVETALGGPG